MSKLRLRLPVSRLFTPGDIFSGRGSFGVLSAVGAARMAILLSRSAAANPELTRQIESLKRRTVTEVVPLISGEPRLDSLTGPLSAVSAFRPDWIVVVGGGSSIDAARLIWALYEHPSTSPEMMERPHALPPLRAKARFAAVPTTAGSGAEASAVAVFQRTALHRKSFLISHELVPDVAVLDPALLRGLDRQVLTATAGDALAHAVEGFASRFANPISDALAETAARRMVSGLRRIQTETSDEVLEDLLVGAFFSGVVQNFAAPGIGHAVAHQLSTSGISHAVSTSSLLSAAVKLNAEASTDVRSKYLRLATTLGVRSIEDLIEHIQGSLGPVVVAKFRQDLSGVDTTTEAFIDGVSSDPCARANPVPVTAGLVEGLLEAATV